MVLNIFLGTVYLVAESPTRGWAVEHVASLVCREVASATSPTGATLWEKRQDVLDASPEELRSKPAVTVRLPFTDQELTVVDGRASREWWTNTAAGKWEIETFKVFNQEIRPGMVYVGFGEWCGVTGMFAAQRASKAILVDADPFIFPELRENVRRNSPSFGSNMALDNRCIMDKVSTLTMEANGGSGSSFMGQGWNKGMKKVVVDCLPLWSLLDEYGVSATTPLFVKIDTEGAEAVIVPSLRTWIAGAAIKPTIFMSMHEKADTEQKAQIAAVLNMYPYFAVFRGRRGEKNPATVSGADTGACKSGFVLRNNADGAHFRADTICAWCDYLVTADGAARSSC